MPALYLLYQEEVAHSKLNQLLELLESLEIEEVAHFKKRSSKVSRKSSLVLGSQEKKNLLKRIKKPPYFGIFTDEVTDIANIQNLVTFIKFYGEEKEKTETTFTNSTDLLHFSETNAADTKTLFDCLINLISRSGLELKK